MLVGVFGWFVGVVIGFGLLLLFYLLCGMVVGDVKLMFVIGVWVGVEMIFYIVLVMFLVGGIGVIVYVLLCGWMC